MPQNYRIFYPLKSLSFAPEGSAGNAYVSAHGLQSVGVTTSFNLEQVFELGQLDIYENIEGLPAVEITTEKVLDGYPLVYHLATPTATRKSLNARTSNKCDVVISLFSDSNDNASGAPLTQVYCSGMFVSALTYTLPVGGNATESVTLTGNDKVWRTSSFLFNGHFNGNDSPASGVQRRQHVRMGNAAAGGSVWPTVIGGITAVSGLGYNIETGGQFGAHIQDTTISTTLGREDIFELGRRKPYYRYATFPVAVDTTINVLAAGNTPGDLIDASSETDNQVNQTIIVRLADGTVFDLGTKNRLTGVTMGGADTGGGLETVSYTFQNFNKLDVSHPADPSGL